MSVVNELQAITDQSERATQLQAFLRDVNAPGIHLAPETSDYWDAAALASLMAVNDLAITNAMWEEYISAAETFARRSVHERPSSFGPWSRLAIISTAASGGFDADASEAFDRTRRAAPFQPEAVAWRIEFSTSIWNDMSTAQRDEFEAEVRFLSTFHRRWRRHLQRLARETPGAPGEALQRALDDTAAPPTP